MNRFFKAAQKELLALLASMQPICNKRTTLDITETIMFQVTSKELTLKATDLEISLQSTMSIDGNLVEPIEFLIPGRRIFDIIKEMEGDIECIFDTAQLTLRAGAVELALHIKPTSDYPQFPERIENLLCFDAPILLQLLNKVAFIIPQNNANNALNGMLLEINEQMASMVATDGHCLAKIETTRYSLPEKRSWLIPKRAVMEIKKLVENNISNSIFLGTCNNQLVVSGDNFNLFTKLIADQFPLYQAVLNKDGFIPATTSRDAFVKTLKRTTCLLSGQFISTDFLFSAEGLNIKLINKEVGRMEEKIYLNSFNADPIQSKFYSPYVLNGLQVLTDDQISFFIKNNSKPIIFETNHDHYHFTYLVMPVSSAQL